MNCPKCGAKMEQGKLYCQICGEEIKIVPDFEPEIENSIHEILTNVADDMAAEMSGKEEYSGEMPQEQNVEKRKKRDKLSYRMLAGIGIGFAVLVLLLAIVGGFLRLHYFSFEYQMDKAYNFIQQEKYDQAITCYSRALELDSQSSLAKYYLAEAYMKSGDVDYALLLFKEVAASEGGAEERMNACRMVVDIYSELGNYQAISDFLLDMGDNDITNSFQKYKAKEPEFSYEEGTYEVVLPLKLTSNTAGTIYYTMDGTAPDETSEVYSSPIFLENGNYVIKAYFVNEYGVASNVVEKAYHIDVSIPFAPEVSAYSGDYSVPTLITVEVPEDSRVYYTTDGSEPTSDSNEYREPIHMPVGKSRFKFVTYNAEGVAGESITREYNLTLNTEVRVPDAEAIINQGMLEIGKIYDLSGLSYEILGKYLYRFQYVTNDLNVGDVYIIAEIYEDTEGIQTRTGALYGVGVYDGKRYRISQGENKQYVFQEF